MNLQNGQITVAQILDHPEAWNIFVTEWPKAAQSPLLRMAEGMTLNQVLSLARGRLPQEKIESLLSQLEEI